MPIHNGSRSDQNERFPPPGPERSQPNPEQFVQGSQSTARSLRVQSQQLPTESQVFEDEVLPATESADHPPEEMSERRDHSKNFSGKARIELCAKSFILCVYDVLARHRSWRLARSGSVSELVNPCSSHAILSTRGRPSAPQPRSSILTNRPAKSRTSFRPWPNSKTYRRASRRLRKATPPNR